jgi:putative ABC transport system substrate-binding protein
MGGAMERRTFMTLVSGGLLAVPLTAQAQQAGKVFQVGFLGTATPSLMSAWLTAFREGLRERGYVEGKNISMQYRWGEGKPERFPGLAAELIKLKVDVIVTSGPQAVRAVQHATTTIPIIMAVIENPVELGFVTSLAHPGGNITGLSFQDSELVTRRLQLLKEVVPDVIRVGVLWNPTGGDRTLKAVEVAATSLGLSLQILNVRVAEDLVGAFEAAKQKRAQAVVQLASPFFAAHRKTILDLSAKSRLPTTCQERTFVVDGCLMASRFACLVDPATAEQPFREEADTAAKRRGATLHFVEVRAATDVAKAFSAMGSTRVDAVIIFGGPALWSYRKQIADLARKSRLATAYRYREGPEARGLMSYGPSLIDSWRRAATYVDKILRGAKPADLPVEQPTKFELVINLKTAKVLGLTIPPALLGRADEVIQ